MNDRKIDNQTIPKSNTWEDKVFSGMIRFFQEKKEKRIQEFHEELRSFEKLDEREWIYEYVKTKSKHEVLKVKRYAFWVVIVCLYGVDWVSKNIKFVGNILQAEELKKIHAEYAFVGFYAAVFLLFLLPHMLISSYLNEKIHDTQKKIMMLEYVKETKNNIESVGQKSDKEEVIIDVKN